MKRLVLDTNVVASAILWGGVPRQLLQGGREKRVSLFTSIGIPIVSPVEALRIISA